MSDKLIVTICEFVVLVLPILGIIIKINSTLTRLNLSIEGLNNQMASSAKDRETIHLTLNDHETRITLLERSNSYVQKR